jgi:hypothetical protein
MDMFERFAQMEKGAGASPDRDGDGGGHDGAAGKRGREEGAEGKEGEGKQGGDDDDEEGDQAGVDEEEDGFVDQDDDYNMVPPGSCCCCCKGSTAHALQLQEKTEIWRKLLGLGVDDRVGLFAAGPGL